MANQQIVNAQVMPQGQDVTKSPSYKLGDKFVVDQAKKHDAMSLSLSKVAVAVADMLQSDFTLFLLGMETAIDKIKEDADYAPLIKSIQNRRSELKRVHAIAIADNAATHGFDKESVKALFNAGGYHQALAKLPKLTKRGGGAKKATGELAPIVDPAAEKKEQAAPAAAPLSNTAAFHDVMAWFKGNKQAMSELDKVKLATFLLSDLTLSKSDAVGEAAKQCFDTMIATRKLLDSSDVAEAFDKALKVA